MKNSHSLSVFLISVMIFSISISSVMDDSFGILPPGHQNRIEEIKSMEIKPSPKRQIEIGIQPDQVFCNEGKILVLKWNDNTSACVKQQTAIRLVELGWGIVKNVDVFVGDSTCGTDFKVELREGENINKKKIIKSIRNVLTEIKLPDTFGEYDIRWNYVFVESDGENSFIVSVLGGFNHDSLEHQEITRYLETMQNVSLVKPRGEWCE